jgi:nitrogen regulatory protein PII
MPYKDAIVNASINLEKGDYALQAIQIPKNSSVMLHSKDRVRLLYVGRRNRPMFLLEQNSTLILREKLEIYYNCNNIREVMRLMIRSADTGQKGSSKVDISKEVKVSLFSQRTS